jgi:acyl-CoA thioesterase
MDGVWRSLQLESGEHAHRFTATIHPHWKVSAVPQGGFVAALATAAMERCVAEPSQRLRSLSCVFAAPVSEGPVVVDVATLRAGRSMSQFTATVRSPDAAAGLTAIAVFGSDRRGYEFTELVPPAAPSPDTVMSWRDPIPEGVQFSLDREPPPFWARVLEGRDVIGTKPWEPFVPSRAEALSWYRFDEPHEARDAPGWAAALVCLDTMPNAVWARTGGDWFGPSADLTAHLHRAPVSEWLLSHTTSRWGGDGYATVDNALWDIDHPDGPTLVATGTQTMFFTFPT